MKNILSGQTMDTTTTTCTGGRSIPPSSLFNNRVSFVFGIFKKKKSFFMWVKKKKKKERSRGPQEASGVSSQWHRVSARCSSSTLWPRKRKVLKDVSYSHCCVAWFTVCVSVRFIQNDACFRVTTDRKSVV